MLIIFDCDGVLVDSEGLAASIFSRSLAAIGWEYSAEQCFVQFQGKTLDACFRWLENDAMQVLPEDFRVQLDAATKQGFARSLRAIEGVESVIRSLRSRSVPFCVASNGAHDKIVHSLRKVGLLEYFPEDRRFSADDVAQGKPSPELFLHAASVVGTPVEACCVIEDSWSGCCAASHAGMPFVYFHHTKSKIQNVIQELKPTAVAYTMRDVSEYIDAIE